MRDLPVQFYYSNTRFPFQDRTRLKQFIKQLFRKEGQKLEQLSYVFCTDQELHSMNQQWLDHDTLTDIITFDLSDSSMVKGEVYISIDRVKDNARAFERPFREELHRVIFHGALHLCGYKDKSKTQKEEMRRMEQKYLDLYLKP